MGLGSAVLIRSVRQSGLQMMYRTIFYLPVTISSVVVGRIWGWIYHPFFGINTILPQIGLSNLASIMAERHKYRALRRRLRR